MAQLFTVPRVALPLGEYLVTMNSLKAAGPVMVIGVRVCTRRLNLDALSSAQVVPLFFTSITLTPCR